MSALRGIVYSFPSVTLVYASPPARRWTWPKSTPYQLPAPRALAEGVVHRDTKPANAHERRARQRMPHGQGQRFR